MNASIYSRTTTYMHTDDRAFGAMAVPQKREKARTSRGALATKSSAAASSLSVSMFITFSVAIPTCANPNKAAGALDVMPTRLTNIKHTRQH